MILLFPCFCGLFGQGSAKIALVPVPYDVGWVIHGVAIWTDVSMMSPVICLPTSWDGCKPEACLSLVFILKDFFPFMVIHLPWPLLPCDLSSMIVQTALHGGLVLHKTERASRPLNLVRELEKHHIYHILLFKASNRSVQIQSGRGQHKGMNTIRWYSLGEVHIVTTCHIH